MAISDININEFRILFDMAKDIANVGYWEWDIQTNEVLWGKQKIEIYGENAENFEPTFEKFLAVIDESTRARVLAEIDDVLTGKKQYYDLQHKIQLKSGKSAWVHEKAFIIYSTSGEPLKMVGIVYDITDKILTLDKLKISQDYSSYLKTHDQLTSLLNKEAIFDYLNNMIDDKQEFSLLFLDIDNFRTLNNTHGHLFGDVILQKVGKLLDDTSKKDNVFRYSSDEFVYIIKDEDRLHSILEKINGTFSKNILLQGSSLRLSLSIGIASFPKDADNAYDCVKNANSALNFAKTSGKGTTLFYDSYMSEELSKKHKLIESLQDAIKKRHFVPHFQPKVNSKNSQIVGFEALARWQSAGEIIPPSFFINVAIENEMINEIDLIILEKSLQQLKKWHLKGHKTNISVNFTVGDFDNIAINSVLNQYRDLLPFLTIEVTETELMSLNDKDIQAFKRLKDFGIKLSLDDFGTGYSSLEYIHKLPIDELKVDKAFVDCIPGEKKDEDLVRIIKSIVDTFELNCVVEGVENESQKIFFEEIGLTTIQGYYYSKPLNESNATKVLTNGLDSRTTKQ